MAYMKTDIKADINIPVDRGEPIGSMEPLKIGESSSRREGLNELAFSLAQRSAGLKRALPPSLVASLADLVRSMNCYYSNLIEGHDTHPIDIERALKNDYSADAKKRDLQLEARAHIEVQQWIDGGGIEGRPTDAGAICDIHRRFCDHLPDALLWIEDPETGERIRITPGALVSESSRAPLRLAFPASLAARWMPGLFPDYVERAAR